MKKVKCFSVAFAIAIVIICGCSNDSNDSKEENAPSFELSKDNAKEILGDDYWDKESIEIPADVTSISKDVFSRTGSKNLMGNIMYFTKSSNIKKITFQKGSRLRDINMEAFYKCNLESIELPEGLEKIDASAFSQCHCLLELKIPKSVTYIGSKAFYDCSKLMELEIQENVTYIGKDAFRSCPELKKLTLPASIKDATVEPESFHILDDFYNKGLIDEIRYKGTIEDWCKITWFKDAVAWRVNKLYFEDSDTHTTSIKIPSTITSIPPKAFFINYGLTSVTFSDSDIIIEEEAFASCDNLSNVEFGSGNTRIEKKAFASCDKLENIKLQNGTIGERAFSHCDNLKYVKLGNGVTSIGDNAFYYCSSLSEMIIPNGVPSIGDSTFSHCSSLSKVVIPSSVTSIGEYAFHWCSKLKSAVFENQNWCRIDDNGTRFEIDPDVFDSEEKTAVWLRSVDGRLEHL